MLGFYGQWHGPVCGDRRLVAMDLGLVISNDGVSAAAPSPFSVCYRGLKDAGCTQLHFREPVKDFRAISAAEDDYAEQAGKNFRGQYDAPSESSAPALGLRCWFFFNEKLLLPVHFKFPAIVQGNGFENVGDSTLVWYGAWPEDSADGVRVAKWQRDRLGYLEARCPRCASSHRSLQMSVTRYLDSA